MPLSLIIFPRLDCYDYYYGFQSRVTVQPRWFQFLFQVKNSGGTWNVMQFLGIKMVTFGNAGRKPWIYTWSFNLRQQGGRGGVDLLKQAFCWVLSPVAVAPTETLHLNGWRCQWFSSSQLKPADPSFLSVCRLDEYLKLQNTDVF